MDVEECFISCGDSTRSEQLQNENDNLKRGLMTSGAAGNSRNRFHL